MDIGWLSITAHEFWEMAAFLCSCFLFGVFVGWVMDRPRRRR